MIRNVRSEASQEPVRQNFKWGIGWRISLGFGLFGIAVGVLVLLTRNTLQESRQLNRQIDGVLAPSIRSLEALDRSIAETRVFINHWLSVQSGASSPEKESLRNLMQTDVPRQVTALKHLAPFWSAPHQAGFDSLERDVEHLFLAYGEIMRLLPGFQSYDDPMARMDAEYYALDGSSIPKFTEAIRSQMDVLSKAQTDALTESTARMEALGDELQFYSGQVALGVLILGILIAWAVTRSIVGPIQELKKALLYLGRGVPLEQDVPVSSDEIGEMASAVNRLASGLDRTRAFSLEVGSGHFSAPYVPLSAEDALGHAIIKMRDELESNELELEGKVRSRTAEVQEQKARIETLYGDLRDSINYAERIQQAILPSKRERSMVFENAAVFYRPRDVVSGDFYWFHKVGPACMFSAVDCTGHGVPGAFMSLIGHHALEHVTKVYTQPDKVLDQLNRASCALLHPDGFGEQSAQGVTMQDGMDLAMVCIDRERMELQYSGANCPLYLVRKGMLQELKPDKMAIASFDPGSKHYTLQTLPLVQGDVIFAATDGFADQFGGANGKKFMRKRFRELLVQIAPLPALEMEQALMTAFDEWRGSEEQVDDVLVIGVRV
jgi:serine phosphatase RsbU (regulator of sigma subunit)/HAMP domain-containing protein